MIIQQLYTGCLSHAAYYLESDGEAAIFDPLREVQPYIDRAARDGASIKYVFETHFHADFVSGHLDLAQRAGAIIVYGPTAKPGFPAHVATDGEVFAIGRARVQAIHTPGHTMESTTYLISDEEGKPHGLITGDTLFVGDVGRPDLAQHVVPGLTQDVLAGHLYDSLRRKIMPLDDGLIIYPNHGAGSACGKNLGPETTSTLGEEKRTNYALRADMDVAEFKRAVLDGLVPPPAYFPKNVLMNMQGYEHLDTVLQRGLEPLPPLAFEAAALERDALIIDSRSAATFAEGFIPGSLNIGLDGDFAKWVGELVDNIRRPILLVADPGREEEAIIRLSRVGYDNTIGHLAGGFDAWKVSGRPVDTMHRITAEEFAARYAQRPLLVDVRRKSEFDTQHVVGAISIPLHMIDAGLSTFPTEDPFILYCAGGYRSMIAASILKQHGRNNVMDVIGGFAAMQRTKTPTSDYVRQSTAL